MKFLDQAKIFLKSGDGGAGAVELPAREIHRVRRARRRRRRPRRRRRDRMRRQSQHPDRLPLPAAFPGREGRHGAGANRTGAGGDAMVLRVPVGTADPRRGQRDRAAGLAPTPASAMCCCAAATAASATPITRAPPTGRRAAPTRAGRAQERWVWLRLKLIADAGLVGCPMPANRRSWPRCRRPGRRSPTIRSPR